MVAARTEMCTAPDSRERDLCSIVSWFCPALGYQAELAGPWGASPGVPLELCAQGRVASGCPG